MSLVWKVDTQQYTLMPTEYRSRCRSGYVKAWKEKRFKLLP